MPDFSVGNHCGFLSHSRPAGLSAGKLEGGLEGGLQPHPERKASVGVRQRTPAPGTCGQMLERWVQVSSSRRRGSAGQEWEPPECSADPFLPWAEEGAGGPGWAEAMFTTVPRTRATLGGPAGWEGDQDSSLSEGPVGEVTSERSEGRGHPSERSYRARRKGGTRERGRGEGAGSQRAGAEGKGSSSARRVCRTVRGRTVLDSWTLPSSVPSADRSPGSQHPPELGAALAGAGLLLAGRPG